MKINSKIFTDRMDKLEKVPSKTLSKSYPFLRNKTPVRSGNARNRTKLSKMTSTIKSNYGYAGPLDDGRSKQAPKGFTDPTIDYMEQTVNNLVGKI
jgi:hypothetical protein